MQILFTETADAEIENFINHYVDSFIRLYTDTGIWSEQEIIVNYVQGAEGLYREIRESIVEKLSAEKVLGRKPSDKISELSFSIGKRLIIVFFSDDKKTNVRWIESISIGKRPIVF